MDLGLRNQSVVVTGGGSNIGRAIVLAFAREGAKSTIGDIDPAQTEKTGLGMQALSLYDNTAESKVGVAAFLEKRKPDFRRHV